MLRILSFKTNTEMEQFLFFVLGLYGRLSNNCERRILFGTLLKTLQEKQLLHFLPRSAQNIVFYGSFVRHRRSFLLLLFLLLTAAGRHIAAQVDSSDLELRLDAFSHGVYCEIFTGKFCSQADRRIKRKITALEKIIILDAIRGKASDTFTTTCLNVLREEILPISGLNGKIEQLKRSFPDSLSKQERKNQLDSLLYPRYCKQSLASFNDLVHWIAVHDSIGISSMEVMDAAKENTKRTANNDTMLFLFQIRIGDDTMFPVILERWKKKMEALVERSKRHGYVPFWEIDIVFREIVFTGKPEGFSVLKRIVTGDVHTLLESHSPALPVANEMKMQIYYMYEHLYKSDSMVKKMDPIDFLDFLSKKDFKELRTNEVPRFLRDKEDEF